MTREPGDASMRIASGPTRHLTVRVDEDGVRRLQKKAARGLGQKTKGLS
jgi:hypothetical protein